MDEIYATVTFHSFQFIGLVCHLEPNPEAVEVERERKFKYAIGTFGDASSPRVVLSGITASLCGFGPLTMNIPFTGSYEGVLLGIGYRVEGEKVAHVKYLSSLRP